jgi:hypothetical protein
MIEDIENPGAVKKATILSLIFQIGPRREQRTQYTIIKFV